MGCKYCGDTHSAFDPCVEMMTAADAMQSPCGECGAVTCMASLGHTVTCSRFGYAVEGNARLQPATPIERSKFRGGKKGPSAIFLQVGDEEPGYPKDAPEGAVSWCADQIFSTDIKYVRADLAVRPATREWIPAPFDPEDWQCVAEPSLNCPNHVACQKQNGCLRRNKAMPKTPRDIVDRLIAQQGSRVAASLCGDKTTQQAAEKWLTIIAADHWHEIISDLETCWTPLPEPPHE